VDPVGHASRHGGGGRNGRDPPPDSEHFPLVF
jgi:hypothetical protein